MRTVRRTPLSVTNESSAMRQCSLDQGGGCLFTVSSVGASPVGLNYYSSMLPCVLLTAMADVTYDTIKRLKRASSYPPLPAY
jgi:hypothetical protein